MNHSWMGKVLFTMAQMMVYPPVFTGIACIAEGPWHLLLLKVFTC